jgi:hypothetical protein
MSSRCDLRIRRSYKPRTDHALRRQNLGFGHVVATRKVVRRQQKGFVNTHLLSRTQQSLRTPFRCAKHAKCIGNPVHAILGDGSGIVCRLNVESGSRRRADAPAQRATAMWREAVGAVKSRGPPAQAAWPFEQLAGGCSPKGAFQRTRPKSMAASGNRKAPSTSKWAEGLDALSLRIADRNKYLPNLTSSPDILN